MMALVLLSVLYNPGILWRMSDATTIRMIMGNAVTRNAL